MVYLNNFVFVPELQQIKIIHSMYQCVLMQFCMQKFLNLNFNEMWN